MTMTTTMSTTAASPSALDPDALVEEVEQFLRDRTDD